MVVPFLGCITVFLLPSWLTRLTLHVAGFQVELDGLLSDCYIRLFAPRYADFGLRLRLYSLRWLLVLFTVSFGC